MKKSRFVAMMASALALVMSTSCLGTKEDDLKVSGSLPHFFNCVFSYSNPDEELLYSGISYETTYNYTDNTATITMQGLALPNGDKYPSLMFEKVPFSHNKQGWKVVDLIDYIPGGIGGYNQAPDFRSFKFNILDRNIGAGSYTYYVPLTDIKYSTDGYQIYSFPEQLIEFPAIKVINQSGEEYVPQPNTSNNIYTIDFDVVKRTCAIRITGAQFADKMPALNMKFADIPFRVEKSGVIRFSIDELIPSLVTGQTDTPSPNHPITNLVGTYTPSTGIVLDYTCTLMSGDQAIAAYAVHVRSEYPTGEPVQQ